MAVKKNAGGRESVKLDKGVVVKVRTNKQKTGVPISDFFEKAAIEKLERQRIRDDKI